MVLNESELKELVSQIHESGALGRASAYRRLLERLVEKASAGQSSSEVDLAEYVFSKSETFDPASDSSVRVYAHNLRKKLQLYYAGKGKKAPYRIYMPRGEYRVEILSAEDYSKTLEGSSATPRNQSGSGSRIEYTRRKVALWAGAIALTSISLVIFLLSASPSEPASQFEYSDEQLAFWGGVLTDDKPVTILLTNATGRFGVQSLSISATAGDESQLDSGTQSTVPNLLIHLVSMLEAAGRPVEISYLSEFSVEDVTGESHILYIDRADGMNKLIEVLSGVEQLEPAHLISSLWDAQSAVLRSGQLSVDDPRETHFGIILKKSLQLQNSEPFEFIVLAASGFTGQTAVVQVAQSSDVLTELQLTEDEARSGGLSAMIQVTASDGFHPERELLYSEIQ